MKTHCFVLNPFLTVGEDWTVTGRRNTSEKKRKLSSFSSLIREECYLDIVLLLKEKKSLNLLFNTGITVLEIT